MLEELLPRNKKARIAVFITPIVLFVLIVFAVILSLIPEKPATEKKDTDISSADNSGMPVSVEDIYLDRELPLFYEPLFYPSRDPDKVWQKEEVSRYFIPVRKILLSYFKKYNDNLVKEIFDRTD